MASHERLTLRNVYLYLVCLITLVISIFAAVSLVRNAVELLYPAPAYYGAQVPGKDSGVSRAEQERQQRVALDAQRRDAVLGLVGSGTLLLISGPLYAYHWRRVQAERSSPE
ncbi:hypothetical protein HC028_25620 [Planosporangium flavigriseum]|uniref:DUF5671 domain-containing protein n=1 Tax=Planosporangium flavigriseum TaxID=373681 RepID=A0A8J3PPV9_9ACTN|nr:hypothetical protein [Planosporangium flavigriseum]NJC67858.1 hypothetical protein [Planosporangium flavigriseum]GIG76323.1 hypothetical protein Pfl04_47270 [Planosporangium flavigriseum]